MAERIYTRDEQGKLEPLEEAQFASEDDLQALLAEHPELLDGEQMRPGDPRRWILIKREKGIAETSDAGDRWALDHLLIDQDATPTLVEVKRGANSEVRRKVVGQMLEYAAHATGGAGSWTVDDIRRDFEDNANAQDRNPDDLIADLLQTDGEPDVEAFWKDVGANLAARRIRLLFVADDIPDSLTRIVSFLNEQTRDNIEVLAVEIKQFSGKTTQTLVPRIIGLTAAAPAKSPPRTKLTRESFLAEFTSDDVRDTAERLLDTASKSGALLYWGSTGVSIRMRCPLWNQPVTVAWLYPSSRISWSGTKSFTFGWGGPSYGYPPELASPLQRWADQFAADDFTEDVSNQGVIGWAAPHDTAAQHIDLLTKRLSAVLSDLKSLGAVEGT